MFWLAMIVLTAGLYLISCANYLLFHALVELFSVVVAGLIFALSWLTREQEYNLFPSVIGVGYAFVGLLDLIHTIAYKGMGIFAETGANLATQLWIAGRFLEATVLLTAPLVRTAKTRHVLSLFFASYGVFVLLTIFWWKVFPVCYLEGSGLTTFKVAAEYAIIALLLTALYRIRKGQPLLPRVIVQYLSYSILVTIISEFCFTLYVNVYDLANFLGHIFKLWSYFLLFYGILDKCIREPLSNLYLHLYQDKLRLERLATTDPLTGLLNRRAANLLIETMLEESRKQALPLSLIMIDIDHFKKINDTYGHQAGDMVLKELAGLILKTVRSSYDVAGRFGGEEFIVALWNTDEVRARAVAERLRREVEAYSFPITSQIVIRATVSSGIARARDNETLEEVIARADKALYTAKSHGRNRTETDV
ncbi:Membrane-associated sensor domain protein [Neomoorella glycerini]|uniref:Membrane-associated sensor domain protein n=1 Tax=Neomoorella glycerini TaxID=55779 RepID=A0A6I5ZV34_9FIRM|nr:GGDEF domain-containing protein [Moorella glycerini]QGP93509.1 Membrane-associated sensor domain protein [Moorella glycerini]